MYIYRLYNTYIPFHKLINLFRFFKVEESVYQGGVSNTCYCSNTLNTLILQDLHLIKSQTNCCYSIYQIFSEKVISTLYKKCPK